MNARVAAVLTAALALTACGRGFEPAEPSGPLPKPPIRSSAPQYVFVGNTGTNTITKYPVTGGAPLLTISNGVNQPYALALDAQGNLYSGNTGNGTITEYNSGGTLVRTISSGIGGGPAPFAIAVDASGNLYSANGGSVTVYPPGATSPSLTITAGVNVSNGVAIDKNGTVYVANGGGTVTEYAAGSTPVAQTISFSGAFVTNVAINAGVNKNGELAVAVCGQSCGQTASDAVYLYAPGQTASYASLGGIFNPFQVLYDSIGNVYVSSLNGGINEYALNVYGQPMLQLGAAPNAMAIDGANDLAEADVGFGVGVQVFPYANSQPAWTITSGISAPWGIAATQN